MVISIVPRIMGMKIENAWGRGARGMVRCTARLSRALAPAELHRIDRLPDTVVSGVEIIHECRPDEVEDWHALLSDALRGEWVVPARPAAQAAGPKMSGGRKPGGTRRPNPAA